MYYHASRTPGLSVLRPHVSNHGRALVYLSARRENTLVYLSNAVELHCQRIGFAHAGAYHTWASYGFGPDGRLRLQEYYPGALPETYEGVDGYIYAAHSAPGCAEQPDIPYAFWTRREVPVDACEYVPDAYEEILRAAAEKKIVVERYEELTETMRGWIARTVRQEYESAAGQPEYQVFLRDKFHLESIETEGKKK